MELFRPVKILLYYTGLLFTHSDSIAYQWFGWFGAMLEATLIYPVGLFVIKTISDRDVRKFSSIMPIYASILNSIYKTIWFLYYRNEVKSLLTALQKNVDNKSAEEIVCYTKSSESADRFVRNFIYIVLATLVLKVLGPITLVLFHYFNGNLNENMMRLPLESLYPYDHHKMPAYALTYVFMCIQIYFATISIVSIDCFVMGVCLNINACFNNLIQLFHNIDMSIAAGEKNSILHNKLKACVIFHNKIFRYVGYFQTIISPLILGQFIFSLIELCTLAFDIVMNKNLTIDQFLVNFLFSVIFLSELFMFCYFGSELSIQSNKIVTAVYNIKWYCNPNITQSLLMIIVRVHNPLELIGMNLIICSLENFTQLIKLVASAFTILKSMLKMLE